MTKTNSDIIVIDEQKFPEVRVWGTKLGGELGLEFYELDDEYFQYIPQHVTYLRFDHKTGDFGRRYWGEIRPTVSEYGENEEGTTQKNKVPVDDNIRTKYVKPFMLAVIRLSIQEIFEKKHNEFRTKYSHLEEATWQDQIAESKAYLSDNTTETKLIHRLAELRGLTTEQFAAKVVAKQDEWKTKLFDLAVEEQTLISKLKESKNVADINVFLEDYYGIAMGEQQCLAFGRCIKNDDGRIIRKIPFEYGIRF